MTKTREEMKSDIVDRAQCMIDSYALVLDNTARMFRKSDARGLDEENISKRADMFWNISLQRMDRDEQEQKQLNVMAQQNIMNGMNVQTVHHPMPQGKPKGKSPCQERAEKDAKRIKDLEAKVITVEAK